MLVFCSCVSVCACVNLLNSFCFYSGIEFLSAVRSHVSAHVAHSPPTTHHSMKCIFQWMKFILFDFIYFILLPLFYLSSFSHFYVRNLWLYHSHHQQCFSQSVFYTLFIFVVYHMSTYIRVYWVSCSFCNALLSSVVCAPSVVSSTQASQRAN